MLKRTDTCAYLYEHPEELAEVEVVREKRQRSTAVLGKHSATESGHQEADLSKQRIKITILKKLLGNILKSQVTDLISWNGKHSTKQYISSGYLKNIFYFIHLTAPALRCRRQRGFSLRSH